MRETSPYTLKKKYKRYQFQSYPGRNANLLAEEVLCQLNTVRNLQFML